MSEARPRGPVLALAFVLGVAAVWVLSGWLGGDGEELPPPGATAGPRPEAKPEPQVGQEATGPRRPPVAAPAPQPAAAHEPVWERGLTLRLLSTASGESDTRRARLVALHVERDSPPSPFLPPGAFRATWSGRLPIPIRDRYRFAAFGKGSLRVQIGESIVLEGRLRGETALESEPVRLRKGDNEVSVVFESGPMGDGTLRLHWSSRDFGWEPIGPENWRHDAAAPDLQRGERLRRGRELFAERRCARCHVPGTAPGEGAMPELSWSGPDLLSAGSRLRTEFLLPWLQDPRSVRPDARMPALRWADPERDPLDVAAWLAAQGSPAAGQTSAPAELVQEGEARFFELGCVACHVEPGAAAEQAALGERVHLGFAARKWWPQALAEYLRAPAAHYPDVRMPDLKLSAEDAEALAAFVTATAPPAPGAGPATGGDPARGAELVARMGCARCHETGLEDRSSFPPLKRLDLRGGCLAGTPGAPDHGLQDRDRLALAEFLRARGDSLARRVPAEFAARAMASLRCTSCHALDGEPSVWARVAEVLAAEEPLPEEMDPVAQGVPALTWAGGKLQFEWMAAFVAGERESPRPWLVARMPAFAKHGREVAMGLLHQHGYPAAATPVETPDPVLAAHGRRLIEMGEGFGCVQCHGVGDRPPLQVFEREGINFARVTERIRKEYYTRWLADPPRIDPDSRMPKYADDRGRTAFTGILDGDAARQFEAIWHYLSTLRPR